MPLACRHPPEGHQIGARKRCAPGNTIILSQPYRRRVSTDRLNREGSQLTASLEGEPAPTPAGKTLPHSYPETRFRREKAQKQKLKRSYPSTPTCTKPWSVHRRVFPQTRPSPLNSQQTVNTRNPGGVRRALQIKIKIKKRQNKINRAHHVR